MALQVTAAALRGFEKFVTGTAEELRSELDALIAEGDGLLEGDWLGVSASKFAPAWEEWKDGARAVVDSLDDEAQIVGESADEYERQEDDNAQSLAPAQFDLSKVNW